MAQRGQDVITGLKPTARRGISTRSQNVSIFDHNRMENNFLSGNNKRKAEASPGKQNKSKMKRAALGNITNAVMQQDEDRAAHKKVTRGSSTKASDTNVPEIQKTDCIDNILLPPPAAKPRASKIPTRAAARNSSTKASAIVLHPPQGSEKVGTIVKTRNSLDIIQVKKQTRRISNEFEKSGDSLYMSALEDVSSNYDFEPRTTSTVSLDLDSFEDKIEMNEEENNKVEPKFPDNIVDFDKENWDDPFQVSHYAMDIFNYLKERENLFQIQDYMEKQTNISKWMRSLLVDWMVEVQESFELNHETLYLAVKIVDSYLSKELITKDLLQLLGAAALFISSKFDERVPPLIDDFLYICDGAYQRKELIQMEMKVFKKIDFDLGMPLSYRFLRRYARCGKVAMSTLTLARYILEYSLMDYTTILFSDSKMAAAALFIALRMYKLPGWNDTLKYYSGYTVNDFADIVEVLNAGILRKPREALKTTRNKYSHKVFLEVAKIPMRMTNELFSGND